MFYNLPTIDNGHIRIKHYETNTLIRMYDQHGNYTGRVRHYH